MLSPINISMESLNLMTLAPMLAPVVGALLILIIDLLKANQDKSLYIMISLLVLGIDFSFLLESAGVFSQNGTLMGVFDVMLIDGLAIISEFIIVAASMLFIPLALTSKRFHEFSYPEFFALFLFMISGFQFMVATDNLILIFVGLETASLALYTLIAMHNRDKSFEAAVKYFTMGALAAGFYAFGSMVVDIGGGTTEIAVISYGGIVLSRSIRVGGDELDEAIVQFVRKEYNLMIGERTSEEIKINIGSAYPLKETITMDVTGRNLLTGLPKTFTLTSKEIMLALKEPINSIVEGVRYALERTPPELSSDIIQRGIMLTGGGALLKGIDILIAEETQVPVIIAENPLDCVAIGTGLAAKELRNQSKTSKKNRRY